MSSFFYSLLSAFIISLISLIGVFFVAIGLARLKSLTLFLVSFAVGSLLGDTFIHILPEIYQTSSSFFTFLLPLVGLLLFFSLEKILNWRHCHDPDCHDDDHSVVKLSFLGDSVHNFIDGAIIAAGFMVSPRLGLTTSLAVILHEIPQEIGDFGIFIHQGLSLKKALKLNFLSALFCLFGVVFTFLFGSRISALPNTLLALAAGGFIYLAASDLIPELHRHTVKVSHSLIQLFFIILGIALMSLLILIE
jgi:zinc and cadmium transporter